MTTIAVVLRDGENSVSLYLQSLLQPKLCCKPDASAGMTASYKREKTAARIDPQIGNKASEVLILCEPQNSPKL